MTNAYAGLGHIPSMWRRVTSHVQTCGKRSHTCTGLQNVAPVDHQRYKSAKTGHARTRSYTFHLLLPALLPRVDDRSHDRRRHAVSLSCSVLIRRFESNAPH